MPNLLLDPFGTANNPVGWSSTTPATVMTGPRSFRESSETWMPGATRPLFQDELAQAKQYSINLFERLGMLPSGGATKTAKMLAQRRVSNLPTPPIRAYHGSPHLVDKFSSGKIGTGEGAQSYGHGLYFAGNEKVGQGYRDALSGPGTLKFPSQELQQAATQFPELYGWLGNGGNPAPMIKHLQELHSFRNLNGIAKNPEKAAALKLLLERFEPPQKVPAGHMYEVALHTAPNRLLDWDLPLGQQPKEILDALRTQRPLTNALFDNSPVGILNGGMTYSNALEHFINPQTHVRSIVKDPTTVERLRKNNIDGVQYFDAGSRRGKEGTRNYVIFDDDIIEILRRYGIGGLGVGLSANTLSEKPQDQGALQ